MQLGICAHYCTSWKHIVRRRCCIITIQAGLHLTVTQETNSHPQRSQELQTNFELKHNFESTGVSFFGEDAPTHTSVHEQIITIFNPPTDVLIQRKWRC